MGLAAEPNTPEVKQQVFISYSRKDVNFARRLAGDLEKAGFDVWWDVSDLKGGDDWVRNIPTAIEASHAPHCKMARTTAEQIFAPIIPLTVNGAESSVCSVLFSISSVSESMVMLPATKAGKNINIGSSTE